MTPSQNVEVENIKIGFFSPFKGETVNYSIKVKYDMEEYTIGPLLQANFGPHW